MQTALYSVSAPAARLSAANHLPQGDWLGNTSLLQTPRRDMRLAWHQLLFEYSDIGYFRSPDFINSASQYHFPRLIQDPVRPQRKIILEGIALLLDYFGLTKEDAKVTNRINPVILTVNRTTPRGQEFCELLINARADYWTAYSIRAPMPEKPGITLLPGIKLPAHKEPEVIFRGVAKADPFNFGGIFSIIQFLARHGVGLVAEVITPAEFKKYAPETKVEKNDHLILYTGPKAEFDKLQTILAEYNTATVSLSREMQAYLGLNPNGTRQK